MKSVPEDGSEQSKNYARLSEVEAKNKDLKLAYAKHKTMKRAFKGIYSYRTRKLLFEIRSPK